MDGTQLRNWRIAHGYRQSELMIELGIKSRQTLSAWENDAGEIPRLVELAIQAVEHVPECRRTIWKGASCKERSERIARSSK